MAKCLTCQTKITGRADKKFCDSECRTAFHNKQNSFQNNFIKNVNNILKKNRRILMQLNPNGKSKTTKEELLDLGFKFSYFTNEYVTKAGKIYHFVYEQGYIELEDDKYALVIRKKYVK
ncbi:type I-A CRISPR-associated protein Cas5a [Saprospiraceae bacterium]|nr:type I-A CRISPR-associated protein Cas5a [Saprospiraceae bacterium]